MPTNRIIIIAEAGVNHNGDLPTALEMVRVAARAGADYVKFQTFKAESLASSHAAKAEYQKHNCPGGGESQLEMLRRLELGIDGFLHIMQECRREGIGFLSTPFDLESIDRLASFGMDYWKIPSGEITDLPYLRRIASKGGKVIMSTGMSALDEVEAALDVLSEGGIPRKNICLLHCTTQYPTPFDAVNLRAMDTLRELGCGGVGYSDHTLGITVPVAAAARGAMVIEKHFTLDRNMEGPDHRASLDPRQLADMVTAVRDCSLSLGSGRKGVAEAERANIAIARRSIVASCNIAKGDILNENNLTTKRPGTGLSPMLWDVVIGTRAVRDFAPDEPIEL